MYRERGSRQMNPEIVPSLTMIELLDTGHELEPFEAMKIFHYLVREGQENPYLTGDK